MKLFSLLFLSVVAFGQAYRFDTTLIIQNLPPGNYSPSTIPNSKIFVNGATYTDASASVTCPGARQVVLNATSACVANPDSTGRFGFWLLPGTYSYSVQLPAGQFIGPFPFTVSGVTPTPQFPANIFVLTVAQLPTASSSNLDFVYLIKDGSTTSDCSSGHGSNLVWCGSNGTSWVSIGASSGGSSGVSSFNTRTGVVVPVTGDYTAAQVTNAVDSTSTYSNPSWITALAFSKVTGVVPESQGGTGANNVVGSAGHYLRSNATHYLDSAIQAGDIPTLNQNTTGTAASLSVILTEALGGTGANNTVGAAGHVLRSNGTHYVDASIQAGDIPVLNQNTTGTASALASTPTQCGGSSPISTGIAANGNANCTSALSSFSSGNFSPLFTTSVATSTTTPALSFAAISQSANLFFASPNGSSGSPTFRAIAGLDLPTPSTSLLGGVKALVAVTHNYVTSITTAGLPVTAQPSCSDLSDFQPSCNVDTTNAANISSGLLPASRLNAHVESVPLTCAPASASGTTYTCNTTPTFTPVLNDIINFCADSANTGSSTLNVNSTGALIIKKQQGQANLILNDLRGTPNCTALTYAGTYWSMDGQLGNATTGGTVTAVATTTPIAGGTINTTGTISCPTCVTSASSLVGSVMVVGSSGQAVGTANGNTSIGQILPASLSNVFINDTSIGTATNKLVKINGTNQVVITGVSDTDGAIGICASGCGTSGSANIAFAGVINCVFDGATTTNDWVQISSTSGDCHDTSSTTRPTSGQVIGKVLSTNGGGGTYPIAFQLSSAIPTGLAPTGTAGGDLSGSYPNPDVVKVNGGTVPTSAKLLGSNGSAQPVAASSSDLLSICLTCVTSAASLTNNAFMMGAGSQASQTVTATVATAALNLFSSTLQGLTPLSGGGSTNFLRADGTWAAPAGVGTVTSVATTSPIGGGTITGSGTLTCTTCVVASSPGVGLAHFAGSTQTATSSLVVNADITNSTIDLTTKVTGALPAANMASNTLIRTIGAGFDGGGSALTTSAKTYFTVPFACTITKWFATVDTGTITFDIWKVASGTAVPTIANTIVASAKPAISSNTAANSTTLTSWTTSVTAGDIFAVTVDTVATATKASIVLQCNAS